MKEHTPLNTPIDDWGPGPFDSTLRLDFLANVAKQAATVNDDGTIVPGSVDYQMVLRILQDAMNASLAEQPEPGSSDPAYAAAGLVAAVLEGHHPDLSTGRRPAVGRQTFEFRFGERTLGTDPFGYSAHCGYVALLTEGHAKTLGSLASQTLSDLSFRDMPDSIHPDTTAALKHQVQNLANSPAGWFW